MTKETPKIVRGERPRRTPVGKKGRLTVSNTDPSKSYRFVNDKDGRVELFQENGWVVEKAEDHRIGDRRADLSSTQGSAARVPVGQGDYSVLMSIDKEWFEEDQAAKQTEVDASEETIRKNVLDGHKGSFQMSVKATG